jgi:hypothetical protein
MNYMLTDGGNADFAALCELLEESLEEAVGATVQRSKYAPMNTLEKIRDAVVVYDGALPVSQRLSASSSGATTGGGVSRGS